MGRRRGTFLLQLPAAPLDDGFISLHAGGLMQLWKGMFKGLLIVAACLLLCVVGTAAEEWVRESPGQKAFYDTAGKLRRVLLDTDGDDRFETEEVYAGRRLSRREDRNGDGVWERRFTWQKDGSVCLVEDNGKGPIQTTWFDAGEVIVKVQKDKDRDGKPETTWFYEDGALEKVIKRRGTWFYKDGEMIRAELDNDGNGRLDRKEYYQKGRLDHVEELSPSGRIRRLWSFDENGKPVRAEEDADKDGRREITSTYHKDGSMDRNVDADGNGKPELRERYSAERRLISRDEDLDGDGVFDLHTGRVKE
jgi:antitoxin component YwqK of YwqJK toxin-antitoxin module